MDNLVRNTLPKSERLCGKTSIERLLAKGRFGTIPSFKYCCLANNGLDYNRILISVPKKIFKRAVKRNLLKRRMRESYRRQKHILSALEAGVDIMIVYSCKEILSYEHIYNSVGQILSIISENAKGK